MLKLLLILVLVVLTIRLISRLTRTRRKSGGITSEFFRRRESKYKNIVDAEFQDVTERCDEEADGIDPDGFRMGQDGSRN